MYATARRREPARASASRRCSLKEDAREKIQARLKKVAGQVAGIQRMVDEDRYCVDVLHQIAAVEGALDRVGHLMLASHVETCVASAIESGKPKERKDKLDELMDVFSRFGRVRP
jgi:CsoR family transcriptional regulator, copper-sensing transcriptional repressor